jgi:hypothetical protein
MQHPTSNAEHATSKAQAPDGRWKVKVKDRRSAGRCGVGAFAFSMLLAAMGAEPAGKSEWVSVGADGKLVYKTRAQGDRILDFSHAGYMGGGVALPVVPVKKTVHPSGGDDTAAIQAAIDEVSKLPLAGGVRGAVLIEAGKFSCSGTLAIRADGVVLRGSGSGAKGTTIEMTGKPHVCVSVAGGDAPRATGAAVAITNAYVPSGATTIGVADSSGFKAGDTIFIQRPATDAWVKFMGMDGLERNGKKEHWVTGTVQAERTITAVGNGRLTVEVPLADSYDAQLLAPPGATVVKGAGGSRITQVGVESLRMVSPPQKVALDDPQHKGIRVHAAADFWIRDLALVDTVGSVSLDGTTRRATVTGVSITHTVATTGSAKPADFSGDGMQLLFDRCTGNGDNLFYFVTGARVTGPIVLLNCTFRGNGHIQPHQRWATGLLVDGCKVPDSGIDFMNRGQMGSGHGWTIGWSVAWNCEAKSLVIQQPPGAVNWAIGCIGARETAAMPFGKTPKLPEGTYDSHGTAVAPASLYLAQLRERLGAQAVKNLGY